MGIRAERCSSPRSSHLFSKCTLHPGMYGCFSLSPGDRVKTKTACLWKYAFVYSYFIFCQFRHSLLHTTTSHGLGKGESQLGLSQFLSLLLVP